MDKIANALLEHEIIDAEEFERLMNENENEEIKNSDVPELPEIRVDNIPKTNTEFLA